MSIVITNEMFLERLKNKHGDKYLALSEYMGNRQPVTIKCNICGHIWKTEPSHIVGRETGCPECEWERRRLKDFPRRLAHIHKDNIVTSDVYINSKTKMLFECKLCKHKWNTQPTHVLAGHGCPGCQGKETSKRCTLSHKEFVDKLKKVHGDNYSPIEQYKKSREKILFHCNLCKNDWMAAPNSLLSGYGCPSCNISKGEMKVKDILEHNQIEFIQGYSFTDCKNAYVLRFDFAVFKDKKLLGLIEYDGIQHFHPSRILGRSS